jgi:hypothetical protein
MYWMSFYIIYFLGDNIYIYIYIINVWWLTQEHFWFGLKIHKFFISRIMLLDVFFYIIF